MIDVYASISFAVSKVYFVIMGRVEAYVHDTSEIDINQSSGIRQAAFVGVWGSGSLWGLNNVMLGGWSEVSPVVSYTRCTL